MKEFANPAFKAAYEKGKKAAREGKSETDCPYSDKRTSGGQVTFSRAFRKRWLEGFREELQFFSVGSMKVVIVGDGKELGAEDSLEDAFYRCLSEYYWCEDHGDVWFEIVQDEEKEKLTFEEMADIIREELS